MVMHWGGGGDALGWWSGGVVGWRCNSVPYLAVVGDVDQARALSGSVVDVVYRTVRGIRISLYGSPNGLRGRRVCAGCEVSETARR